MKKQIWLKPFLSEDLIKIYCSGRKKIHIACDLYKTNYNINEEAGKKFMEDYEKYLYKLWQSKEGKNLFRYVTYNPQPSTIIHLTILEKDLSEWQKQLFRFLDNPKNFEMVEKR